MMVVLRAERLEARRMLSADLIVSPATSATPMASSSTPTGFSPSQVRQAYGLNNITFGNGTIVGDGSGQTIAIVVAYDNPYITSDLHIFSQTYGLPDASLQVVKQTASLSTNGGWALESSLDVQWAHAIAPRANLLLVEAKSDSLNDLMTMVNVARQQPGVVAVSMSWGISEFAGQTNYDNILTTPLGHQGITFVAASGDNGSWLGASYPAISPNVLGVGGTQLFVSGDGTYLYETAWGDSGGGYSRFYSEPAYQATAQGSAIRTSPDVAWNGSVTSGVSVYSTLSDTGPGGWFTVGGTSAGTPAWAAIIAIADQGRAINGQGSLAGAQSLVYTLSSSDFHDITSGRNGYSASAGYDLVTGLGTPYADRVVTGLASATVTNPTGSFTSKTSTRRIRRLNRNRVRRHDEIGGDSGFVFTIATPGVGASSSATSGSPASLIEVTTLNPNQAILVVVVTNNGRLVEEIVVPVPTLSIAEITHSQPISPSLASLATKLDLTSNAERIGQGDDPQVPTAETKADSDDSPVPSIKDLMDLRKANRKTPGRPAQEGVPADLTPQDAPKAPKDQAPLPPVSTVGVDVLTRWNEGDTEFEWSTDLVLLDHFAAMNRNDLGRSAGSDATTEAEVGGSEDGASLAAAAAVAIGGARLLQIRTRDPRGAIVVAGDAEAARQSEPQSRRPARSRRRAGADPFRHLLQRSHR